MDFTPENQKMVNPNFCNTSIALDFPISLTSTPIALSYNENFTPRTPLLHPHHDLNPLISDPPYSSPQYTPQLSSSSASPHSSVNDCGDEDDENEDDENLTNHQPNIFLSYDACSEVNFICDSENHSQDSPQQNNEHQSEYDQEQTHLTTEASLNTPADPSRSDLNLSTAKERNKPYNKIKKKERVGSNNLRLYHERRREALALMALNGEFPAPTPPAPKLPPAPQTYQTRSKFSHSNSNPQDNTLVMLPLLKEASATITRTKAAAKKFAEKIAQAHGDDFNKQKMKRPRQPRQPKATKPIDTLLSHQPITHQLPPTLALLQQEQLEPKKQQEHQEIPCSSGTIFHSQHLQQHYHQQHQYEQEALQPPLSLSPYTIQSPQQQLVHLEYQYPQYTSGHQLYQAHLQDPQHQQQCSSQYRPLPNHHPLPASYATSPPLQHHSPQFSQFLNQPQTSQLHQSVKDTVPAPHHHYQQQQQQPFQPPSQQQNHLLQYPSTITHYPIYNTSNISPRSTTFLPTITKIPSINSTFLSNVPQPSPLTSLQNPVKTTLSSRPTSYGGTIIAQPKLTTSAISPHSTLQSFGPTVSSPVPPPLFSVPHNKYQQEQHNFLTKYYRSFLQHNNIMHNKILHQASDFPAELPPTPANLEKLIYLFPTAPITQKYKQFVLNTTTRTSSTTTNGTQPFLSSSSSLSNSPENK